MKKILSLILVLALCAFGVTAFAATPIVPFEVQDGYSGYFDPYSDVPYTMHISFTQADDGTGDLIGFTIDINGQYAVKNAEILTGRVYAAEINSGAFPLYGTLFMVEDSGLSDYAVLYCFFVSADKVIDLGPIPGTVDSLTFNANGTISTFDRSSLLGTWAYPVDYIMAYGFFSNGDMYDADVALASLPADNIPMGVIATLNMDLPVMASPMDNEYCGTIAAGQRVILTATDMVSRVYVSTIDESQGGWVWISESDEYGHNISVNGVWTHEATVFSDLPYAG